MLAVLAKKNRLNARCVAKLATRKPTTWARSGLVVVSAWSGECCFDGKGKTHQREGGLKGESWIYWITNYTTKKEERQWITSINGLQMCNRI